MNIPNIQYVDAYKLSGQTGVLTSNQSRLIVEQARSLSRSADVVAISMKGISSLSINTAAELCADIISDKELATKIAITGSTPYVRQIIGIGMRNATKK